MSRKLALLASLVLIPALLSACGSSERRGSATGYDGSVNVNPDNGNSGGSFATTVADLLSIEESNDLVEAQVECACSFDAWGYNSAEQCADDISDSSGLGTAISSCIRQVVSEQPAPPASLNIVIENTLDALQAYERCLQTIDTQSCDETSIEEAIEACEDERDEIVDGQTFTPEDQDWLRDMQDAVEVSCFSTSPEPQPGNGGNGGGQVGGDSGDGGF
ncbi:hypothetical protein EA187_16015 [Lujinxingia sediminis]|uniref:DUF4189 domain-containing protein n=1 Tax=Lujinxingia sediminis TaxID=2480984 RepID=A0ABY0CPK9_9DELT|nr:hypothetical protein [Lujinxingia sediminis]RVU42382.1 hypothetical protein EA187_16015 [Lujinxingia sediminis]